MIKFDNNAPTPRARKTGFAEAMRKIKVGQSLTDDESTRQAWIRAARNEGIKITTRADGNGGIRVWRLA